MDRRIGLDVLQAEQESVDALADLGFGQLLDLGDLEQDFLLLAPLEVVEELAHLRAGAIDRDQGDVVRFLWLRRSIRCESVSWKINANGFSESRPAR